MSNNNLPEISGEAWRKRKQYVEVRGRRMAYIEAGVGKPIVLLHGNPTSSYLWRHVIPEVQRTGCCIAPDLIGMGDSDKLPDAGAGSYRFDTHREYLDGFLDAMDLRADVLLVVHDWGSALGFDWARRHPGAVRGIAYMEAIVTPLLNWQEWPAAARGIFQGFRSNAGEELVLERNLFVEGVLPAAILRKLSAVELDAYRAPFAAGGESRRPMLDFPRDIPIDGEPEDVVRIVSEYASFLEQSTIEKLFIDADPGGILTGRQRDYCRGWPNQREHTVRGSHFIQEDSGPAIGQHINRFAQEVG